MSKKQGQNRDKIPLPCPALRFLAEECGIKVCTVLESRLEPE
jgi:hypothetical protein